jgi:MFS transporter, DHA1 family, inner membrane transport protein
MGESEASAKRSNAARERGILLTLAAVQFTSIVDFMVIMPLQPKLEETMRITGTQFGYIVASYAIAAGISGFIASSFIDRVGRKSAFLGLYVGFLVGTLLCGLATSYSLLLAARLVTGAFGGVLGGLALAIVGDVFPDERRGRATGVLMASFSLASVFGVPIGIKLGYEYGWQYPFLVLAGLGVPLLFLGFWFLPPLRDHLNKAHVNQWSKLKETYSHPNHIRAFLLVVSMMMGTFMVVPWISGYLVGNVGLLKDDLPWIFFGGGACTLISSPLIGRWADRFGKLKVYRIIAPFSAVMMITLTTLPRIGGVITFAKYSLSIALLASVVAVSLMMISNTGRMVAALAMINGSVEPRLRGGFMSAYSSIQHISSGIGAFLAGLIIVKNPGVPMRNYGWVGLAGVAATLLSLWLAGRLRPASIAPRPIAEPMEDLLETVPAAEAF